jgi:hypothetical protein
VDNIDQPSISGNLEVAAWAKVRVAGNPEVTAVENECIADIENNLR